MPWSIGISHVHCPPYAHQSKAIQYIHCSVTSPPSPSKPHTSPEQRRRDQVVPSGHTQTLPKVEENDAKGEEAGVRCGCSARVPAEVTMMGDVGRLSKSRRRRFRRIATHSCVKTDFGTNTRGWSGPLRLRTPGAILPNPHPQLVVEFHLEATSRARLDETDSRSCN